MPTVILMHIYLLNRHDINDVLNLNARIDNQQNTDSLASSAVMSHANSVTSSPPMSPARKEGLENSDSNPASPGIRYTNTSNPGSAQRYIRT